jgi:hypothetical protein
MVCDVFIKILSLKVKTFGSHTCLCHMLINHVSLILILILYVVMWALGYTYTFGR